MLWAVASFADALEENPAPRRLGDIRLRYEPGRLLGESLSPSFWRRQLPGTCLVLAALCASGAVVAVLWGTGAELPPLAMGLGGLGAALVGLALWLEGQLGRRRFVLHFPTERLRLEQLRWAPGATRVEWVPFDEVFAVEVVERGPRRYALVVAWRSGGEAGEERRAVLVEHIGAGEEEALFRVWRLLHNAFGLRGAGIS
jgi:hypothetical protein